MRVPEEELENWKIRTIFVDGEPSLMDEEISIEEEEETFREIIELLKEYDKNIEVFRWVYKY